MTARKVPPYEELKRLYVQERLSFNQIAARFGTGHTSVSNTLRRDAAKAGDRWPLRAPNRPGTASTLPSYEILRKHYLDQGMSTAEIAKKYGAKHKDSVLNVLRVGAKKNGHTWPMKRSRPDYARKRGLKIAETVHDSVTARMVRLEIHEFCPKFKVSRRELALAAGLSESVVARIACGAVTRCSRRVAHAIVRAIEEYEAGKRTPVRMYQPARRSA